MIFGEGGPRRCSAAAPPLLLAVAGGACRIQRGRPKTKENGEGLREGRPNVEEGGRECICLGFGG